MEYRIEERAGGTAVRDYIRKNLSFSRSQLVRLKNTPGGILVNGSPAMANEILKAGDVLSLKISDGPEDENANLVPTEMPLDIIYEDEDLIVLNKPASVPTHPSHGHFDDSLANGLAFYFSSKGIPFVFRAVNRLDRDTSGVVAVAKNGPACSALSEQIKNREAEKRYLAVTHSRLKEDSGEIRKRIKRVKESVILRAVCGEDEGEEAATGYRLIRSTGDFSLYDVTPITGRTHQIRVHFASEGCPLAGDYLYGKREDELIHHHALCAYSLTVRHPSTGERMTFRAEPDGDFKKLLDITGLGTEITWER